MLTRTATHTASSGPAPHTASVAEPSGLIEAMGAQIPFARNAEIYGEGEPADYVYKLVRGTVRTSKILADGRRQIGAFYFPGDVFGLEVGDEHAFSAEAISDVTVIVAKRSAIL